MQFQSDLLNIPVRVPDSEELSGIGAAWAAGLAIGLYDEGVFNNLSRVSYAPRMDTAERDSRYAGWKDAVKKARAS